MDQQAYLSWLRWQKL